LSGCYVPWNIKSEETALDRNNTKPVEEMFNDSKSVPSDCITGIKNILFPAIIAGFHSGILSLLILPVELEFKICKCNIPLRLLHFAPVFHFVTENTVRVPVIRLQKESN
jgi:hypothetical protein